MGKGQTLNFQEMKALFEEGSYEDWEMEAEGKFRHKEQTQVLILDVGLRELGAWYPAVPYAWADVVPAFQASATAVVYVILDGDNLVWSIPVALVDGDRGVIPYPHNPDYTTIERWLYKFALVVETPGYRGSETYGLDKWLERAGIHVV